MDREREDLEKMVEAEEEKRKDAPKAVTADVYRSRLAQ
jgi:hypothetical protein